MEEKAFPSMKELAGGRQPISETPFADFRARRSANKIFGTQMRISFGHLHQMQGDRQRTIRQRPNSPITITFLFAFAFNPDVCQGYIEMYISHD